jgi:CheY-like chemotaxis protein
VAGQTILVVEDDTLQREGLRSVLQGAGYAVAVAGDAAEALCVLRGPAPPALVLLDMLFPRRPDADGWHFLSQRQQAPALRPVPVVITTALGNASPEWAESLGAGGYLRKPFDADRLLAEVRRWCP